MVSDHVHARIHYAFIVVAVTFVVILIASGIRSVPSLLIIPLENEFGWDRVAVSAAVSINLLFFGICGPFAAATAERIGLRYVMMGALLLLSVAQALTTVMTATWQLQLLWGLAVGIGSGTLSGWISATVANRWFTQHRGLVLGLLQAGGSTGQVIFLPLLASVLVSTGWRAAVLFVAAVSFLAVPVVARFFRDLPNQAGVQPYGAQQSVAAPAPASDLSKPAINPFTAPFSRLGSDIKDSRFLLLAGSFAVCGASAMGVMEVHFISASIEQGIPEVTAAGMLAVIGFLNMFGTTASGWLSDRLDNRWLLAWVYGVRGLLLIMLPYAFASGYISLAVFVVIYGLDWMATVPPTVRLLADSFGKENVGTIYAWVIAAHQLGAGAAALSAGSLRVWLGDYTVTFVAAGTLALMASGLFIVFGGTFSRVRLPEVAPAAPANV